MNDELQRARNDLAQLRAELESLRRLRADLQQLREKNEAWGRDISQRGANEFHRITRGADHERLS